LKIIVEDMKGYPSALEYIAMLSFQEVSFAFLATLIRDVHSSFLHFKSVREGAQKIWQEPDVLHA